MIRHVKLAQHVPKNLEPAREILGFNFMIGRRPWQSASPSSAVPRAPGSAYRADPTLNGGPPTLYRQAPVRGQEAESWALLALHEGGYQNSFIGLIHNVGADSLL
jgi:hypothetical protein